MRAIIFPAGELESGVIKVWVTADFHDAFLPGLSVFPCFRVPPGYHVFAKTGIPMFISTDYEFYLIRYRPLIANTRH
jgi:hypothetical protein